MFFRGMRGMDLAANGVGLSIHVYEAMSINA